MFEGTLIAESLRTGSTLDGLSLTVRKIARYAPGGTTDDQPAIWTAIEFEIADDRADALASALTGPSASRGGTRTSSSPDVAYVVFRDKAFRYPRGDPDGRAAAQAHGRALGVPEPQLDWTV